MKLALSISWLRNATISANRSSAPVTITQPANTAQIFTSSSFSAGSWFTSRQTHCVYADTAWCGGAMKHWFAQFQRKSDRNSDIAWRMIGDMCGAAHKTLYQCWCESFMQRGFGHPTNLCLREKTIWSMMQFNQTYLSVVVTAHICGICDTRNSERPEYV